MPNFTDVIWPPLTIPQPVPYVEDWVPQEVPPTPAVSATQEPPPYVENWVAQETQPADATAAAAPSEDQQRALLNFTPLLPPPFKIYP